MKFNRFPGFIWAKTSQTIIGVTVTFMLWFQCFLFLLAFSNAVQNDFLHSAWIICSKFVPLVSLSLEWGLLVVKLLLIRVQSLLYQKQSCVLWVLYMPPCFLHRTHCFSVQTTFVFFGIWESIDSIVLFQSVPIRLLLPKGFTSTLVSFSILSKPIIRP